MNFMIHKEVENEKHVIEKDLTDKKKIINFQQDTLYGLIDKMNIDEKHKKMLLDKQKSENQNLKFEILEYPQSKNKLQY